MTIKNFREILVDLLGLAWLACFGLASSLVSVWGALQRLDAAAALLANRSPGAIPGISRLSENWQMGCSWVAQK